MNLETYNRIVNTLRTRRDAIEDERQANCKAKAYNKNKALDRAYNELDNMIIEMGIMFPDMASARQDQLMARVGR